MQKQQPTTEAEARQYAIDWQNWQSEQNLSYGDLDLLGEFTENGIL